MEGLASFVTALLEQTLRCDFREWNFHPGANSASWSCQNPNHGQHPVSIEEQWAAHSNPHDSSHFPLWIPYKSIQRAKSLAGKPTSLSLSLPKKEAAICDPRRQTCWNKNQFAYLWGRHIWSYSTVKLRLSKLSQWKMGGLADNCSQDPCCTAGPLPVPEHPRGLCPPRWCSNSWDQHIWMKVLFPRIYQRLLESEPPTDWLLLFWLLGTLTLHQTTRQPAGRDLSVPTYL